MTPICLLSQCPNKVQKSGYNPWGHVNGCGSEGGSEFPDAPMSSAHATDSVYLTIHGSTDGGNFIGACNAHDACYANCNSEKIGCDVTFGDTLRSTCYNDYNSSLLEAGYLAECLSYAVAYEAAVSLFGGSAYDSTQKTVCNCC